MATRYSYGRNGAETISGLCGTRVVLAAPDRDTAQWSADSLGRSEVEEVTEGFSYGANTIRDGVSLTPKRELRPLALASEIMQLQSLHGWLRFPGPLPVAPIRNPRGSRPGADRRARRPSLWMQRRRSAGGTGPKKPRPAPASRRTVPARLRRQAMRPAAQTGLRPARGSDGRFDRRRRLARAGRLLL